MNRSHNNSDDRSAIRDDISGLLRETMSDLAHHEKHFQTDHLLDDLESRTVSGGFITAASQGIQFVLTLGSTMVLARLLTPRDFGLLAMVWTIMGFLRIFKDAGLSTATVQRDDINHTQVSNLFWVNVAVSGFISLLVAASAPLVAWFYREPRLVPITLALSSIFLLAGLVVQHTALLSRQMRFKTIAVIQVVSLLAGVLTGVCLAWLDYGYWSLVWMNLTTNLVALLMTWFASSWRPQFFKRRSGTRSLLHFGANLTVSTFLYSLARGLDGLLIGRFWGAVPLGLYSRASAMLTRPMEQFIAPIEAVVIPAFSRLQSQPERYRQNFVRLYEIIALAGFFFTAMFFALAHPLTLVVLGRKWEAASIIFAALSFAALQAPLGSSASWLITSQGRGKDSLKAGLIISIVVALSFIAGLPYGPAGVAIAYSASCLLIQTPIYYWIVGRSGPVRTADLWIGFFKHLPVWAVVTLTAWFTLKTVPNLLPLAQLAVCIPVSLLAGVAFIFVYSPSRRVAAGLFSTLRELKNPSKTDETLENDRADDATLSSLAPGISVVIPTFNRSQLLKRAIESVLSQTLKADQIIVVDDGSTDGTPEMCRQFSGSIEYVRQSNVGVSEARNHGIKLARHAWIAFLDSDDHWTSTHLESITAAIKATDGRARFYFSNVLMANGAQNTTLWSQIGLKFDGPFLLLPNGADWMLSSRQPTFIQSSIFNAVLLKSSGGFDKRFESMEDTELFCRLGVAGSVCAVNAIGCCYSADDSTDKRLTAKVNPATENFWKSKCMLWSLVRSRFPDLDPGHRHIIHCKLAESFWRLARNRWQTGQIFSGIISFLQCIRTQPSFLFVRMRERAQAGGPT
ncbi:MAG TPA: oligosaccharide flippase family protein [Candidatus Acidoferrales bacterium]|nr:oligosaccharide flippase family protein [Candidatus Acidoferrales bacterium]